MSSLEDYPSAIRIYEELLRRFPNSAYREEAYFNLVYAWLKTGDKTKSDYYKNLLISTGGDNKFAQLIKNPAAGKEEDRANSAATRKYEQIYNLFIEGDFAKARQEKTTADSAYGKIYWTPQLLFIESIYYIKIKDDSTAIKVLSDMVATFPQSNMVEMANTLINVLRRRKEIEAYLTNLDVKRQGDKPKEIPRAQIPKTQVPPPVIKPVVQPPVPKDTAKVDTAAKNIATKDTASKPVVTTKDTIANKPLKDTVAIDSKVAADTIKPDTVLTDISIMDTVPQNVLQNDTGVVTPPNTPVISINGFTYSPSDPHYVVVLLDKVDPVYASEAKNAFNRFNRDRYFSQQIAMSSLQLDDRFSLVLQGPFTNASAAVDYVDNTRPVAGSRILPWLKADKYSFIVISEANLEVLKTSKNMDAYKQLLQQAFPGKF